MPLTSRLGEKSETPSLDDAFFRTRSGRFRYCLERIGAPPFNVWPEGFCRVSGDRARAWLDPLLYPFSIILFAPR